MNEDGVRSIYAQAILNAALNIQAYVKHGIIVDGKITNTWPKRKKGKLRGHNLLVRGVVRFKHEAEQDIEYFTNGMCDADLVELGSKMDAKTILKQALAGKVANLDLCTS